ncbi:MAG: uracil-DNA glycosylase [Chloroflexota bacterium]|nr:uracil-DNA glycosylase [Chloroflexota bacterium]
MLKETKAFQLKQLAEKLVHLEESPLFDYRQANGYQPVPGEGDSNADVIFIGEAPGAMEAETGRPFVGRAGQMLDELLRGIGLNREDVFITNIVKDRPPENRDPTRAEIVLYAPLLTRQIEIIQPKVIATLGRYSMVFMIRQYNLPGKRKKIGQLHGQVLKGQTNFGDIRLFPLYHPAAVFYNRSLTPILEEDFQKLARLL